MPLYVKFAIVVILLFIAATLYAAPLFFGFAYLLIATIGSGIVVANYIAEKLDES